MKNTRFHARFIFVFAFTALSLAASAAFAEGSAISMEDAVGKGLLRSPEIASAAARLKSSDAALAADVPWRSGALTLKSDAKDQDSVKTGESAYGWSAGASLPLFDRLSLGASVSGDTAGAASGSVTASLKPFATTSIAARLAANSALFDYLLLVRTTTLALRSSVRALQVAEAEVAYRKAELSAKDFALERARLLVERGDAKRASLLDALSARTDALIALDAAEAAAEDARWTLATGTGMESAELSVMTEPLAPESAPVSEETWIRSSQKVVKASSDAESAADEARLAVPRPDLAIQGNLSSILAGSAAGTTGWTASATIWYSVPRPTPRRMPPAPRLPRRNRRCVTRSWNTRGNSRKPTGSLRAFRTRASPRSPRSLRPKSPAYWPSGANCPKRTSRPRKRSRSKLPGRS